MTPDRDADADSPERVIYISGTPQAMELAHSLVNDVINEGLSRNYRDGVEPRPSSGTPSDEQESHSVDDAHRESGLPEVSGSSPQVSRDQVSDPAHATEKADKIDSENRVDTPRGNGSVSPRSTASAPAVPGTQSAKTAVNRAEDDCDDSHIPHATADASREHTSASPEDPEEGATIASRETWDVDPDEAEGTVDGDQEQSRQVQADAEVQGNAFAGEGRVVQRPATDYPSHSITFEMQIPHAKVGVIIGKKGSTIRMLQQKSGARIVVSKKIDTSTEENLRPVLITGPKPFVETARRLIVARVNTAGELKGEEGDPSVDPLDFDESLLGEDTAIENLSIDFANSSLTSPSSLPQMMPNSPSPVSPMRVPQTPPFSGFQRPMHFVGSTTPQFGPIQPYRPFLRGEASDMRQIESTLQHAPGQYQQPFLGPPQFDRRQMPGFPYEQSQDGGDMPPSFAEFRPGPFYPPTGGMGPETVPPYLSDISGSVGPAFNPVGPQGYNLGAETPFQEEAFDNQSQPQSKDS